MDTSPAPAPSGLVFVDLPAKSGCSIASRAVLQGSTGHDVAAHSVTSDDLLIIFINGLMTTLTSWTPVLDTVAAAPTPTGPGKIYYLAYDRLGQGLTTTRDPADLNAANPAHGHGIDASVQDLHELVSHFSAPSSAQSPKIVLVASSIGVAISRLYAQIYPGTVAGQIHLDSIIREADLLPYFPDPDAEGFDESTLVDGITVDDLKQTRVLIHNVFGLHNGSREGLTRTTIRKLLPHGDQPKLLGWRSDKTAGSTAEQYGPYLAVFGHDPETYARQAVAHWPVTTAAPQLAYLQPVWEEWNKQLCRTSGPQERVKGPIIVEGAGHFIQTDRPDLVAAEVLDMVEKVRAS
ncbi:Hypothetical protein D9617_1g083040 [Elsinoe fawcettii]|nr:Hypothetical protein D9617_1g083040 [Elsinoe fawcettii]